MWQDGLFNKNTYLVLQEQKEVQEREEFWEIMEHWVKIWGKGFVLVICLYNKGFQMSMVQM